MLINMEKGGEIFVSLQLGAPAIGFQRVHGC